MYSILQLNAMMQHYVGNKKGKVVKFSYEKGVIELVIKDEKRIFKERLHGKSFVDLLNKFSPSGYKRFRDGRQFAQYYENLLKLYFMQKQYNVNFDDYQTKYVESDSVLLNNTKKPDLLIMNKDDYKIYKKIYKK